MTATQKCVAGSGGGDEGNAIVGWITKIWQVGEFAEPSEHHRGFVVDIFETNDITCYVNKK